MSSLLRGFCSKVSCSAVAFVVLLASAAEAGTFSYNKIADQGSPVSGDVLTEVGIPSISSGSVAFKGRCGVGCVVAGFPSSLRIVARTGNTVPGTTGTVADLGYLRFPEIAWADNGRAVFGAFSTVGTGIFSGGAEGFLRGIDTGSATSVPGQTGAVFCDIGMPAVHNGTVAFAGSARSRNGVAYDGIYTSSSRGLTRIADATFPMRPHGSGVGDVGCRIGIFDGKVAFTVGNGQAVWMIDENSSVTGIAYAPMVFPGTSLQLRNFDYPAVSSGGVSFWAGAGDAGTGGLTGILTTIGGSLRVVASESTPVPEGTGCFSPFPTVHLGSGVASSGNRVVFYGESRPADGGTLIKGIYLWDNGRLHKVVHTGDVLGGVVVNGFNMGPQAIEGDTIVFWVHDAGGAQSAWMARLVGASAAGDWNGFE